MREVQLKLIQIMALYSSSYSSKTTIKKKCRPNITIFLQIQVFLPKDIWYSFLKNVNVIKDKIKTVRFKIKRERDMTI